MSNSKQRRFAIGVTSLLLLSSCKPLLSSKGETHSPYQPSQKQNTQKTAGTTASSGGHGSAGVPGASGATGATGSATAPTGAPASTNKDLDRALDEINETEALKVSFNDAYNFPNNVGEFDSKGCRSVYVRGGVPAQKDPDTAHFSCLVLYCVNNLTTDSSVQSAFQIPKDTVYIFRKQGSHISGDRQHHVRLQSISGWDDIGSINELQCDSGLSGTLTVRDLIEAFGKDSTGKQDVLNPQIVDFASLLKPAPTGSARAPASVPTVSQTTRGDREKEREMADLPNFALQLTGSVRAFGGSTISPAQEGTKSGAMLVQLEYQPSFLQHFGILSIGPSFGTYPTLGSTQADEKVTPGFFAITGVGGQVRYQLHYFDNQFVVPYASYEAQSLSYRINGGGSGRLTVAGGSGGLSLLLNRLAPSEAIDMKHNLGISRSYLVVEGKYLYGTDQNVRVSGTSVFFGLRFER